MAKLTQLLAAKANLDFHIDALQQATNDPPQGAIDGLTNAVVTVDGQVAAVLTAPPPTPPTGLLDFSAFDDAVTRFKNDGNLLQADVDAVTKVLTINTK